MPTGLSGGELGGVIDPVDVAGLGTLNWEEVTGIPANSPIVGGGVGTGYSIEQGPWSKVVTQPVSQAGPASDVISTPEGMPATSVAGARDLLNPKGSWVPWVLGALILIVVFAHLRVGGGAGVSAFGKSLKAGATLR